MIVTMLNRPHTDRLAAQVPILNLAIAALCIAALTITVIPRTAAAKSSRTASYEFSRAWRTAVRFLRIDLGYNLTEKDAENGYILFDFKKGDRTYPGSLEVIRVKDYAERDAVKLILDIKERPQYDEDWILAGLAQKLRDDHGLPPEPSQKKPPSKTDDKNTSHKKDDGKENGDKENDGKESDNRGGKAAS